MPSSIRASITDRADPASVSAPRRGRTRGTRQGRTRHPFEAAGWLASDGIAGVAILTLLVLVAVVGPALTTDPLRMHIADRLAPPSSAHLMGTDEFGRDILSRVVNGARISLIDSLRQSLKRGVILAIISPRKACLLACGAVARVVPTGKFICDRTWLIIAASSA